MLQVELRYRVKTINRNNQEERRMENQAFEIEQVEAEENCQQLMELFDLQLAIVGGGCVEYCPY